MDGLEFMILIFSGYYVAFAAMNWYRRIVKTWPSGRNKTARYILGFLPVLSFFMILYTLKELASFDVVGDGIYIILYLFLGFAWIFFGMRLVFKYFDLSWIDDVLENENKAALIAVTGAYLGLALIYSGANVGDGPGWWCVVFAGGLGVITWIIAGVVINKYTHVFERITVDRDIYCGIRFGSYLAASGFILARASAGDWTSFYMTIVEFMVGWPVILLALLAVAVERWYMSRAKTREHVYRNQLPGSICWSVLYILAAVISVVLFPLPENPIYDQIPAGY